MTAAGVEPSAAEPAAAGELRRRGWAVLPTRLDPAFVAELAAAFAPVLDRHLAASGPNRGVQRHQVYLPFEPPFSDPALYADPAVLAVVDAVLGADAECSYYGSDTPFPGAEHQPVHTDGGPLFPELGGPGIGPQLPIYALAFNVPLVDVDADNGPIELFDGPERPGEGAEPVRCTGPAGSCLLRDTRVWHRGSPNRSAEPRPMLALLYTRPWFRFLLDRPAMTRATYEALPDAGRRLFRGADITDRHRATGDEPRLAVRR